MTATTTPRTRPASRGRARTTATSRTLWTCGAAGVLILLCAVSLTVGSHDVSLPAAWQALLHGGDSETAAIVRDSRLPRTVTGILAGAALGAAGALIMALTRNPLADPGVLGVNAGAQLCVVLGMALFGLASFYQYVWFSCAGAVATTVIVYLIGGAGRGGPTPVKLTMAGVALGSVITGVTSAIVLVDRETFDRMRSWAAGSLTGPDLDLLVQLVPVVGAGLLLALGISRSLNAITLGDDLAAAIGARTSTTRAVGVLAVTLLCGSVTAVAGPIGFVGLMVPHVARWLLGPDQRWIIGFTAVAAPSLVLLADVIGRLVLPFGEVPAGVVTAFLGAPVLIMMIRRRRVSGL